MNVQELIDALMKIEDKTKPITMVFNAGTDFDKTPFLESGVIDKVQESEEMVELLDDLTPLY